MINGIKLNSPIYLIFSLKIEVVMHVNKVALADSGLLTPMFDILTILAPLCDVIHI